MTRHLGRLSTGTRRKPPLITWLNVLLVNVYDPNKEQSITKEKKDACFVFCTE